MFSVVRKQSKYVETIPITVYDIKNDKNGYPHFLIYENNEWKYVSAKHFIPVGSGKDSVFYG